MNNTVALLVMGFLGIGALLILAYCFFLYNDLAQRLERLKGMWADIKTMESRRFRVQGQVTHRVGRSMRFESGLRQPGVDRRGARGGIGPLVVGNGNGLPNRSTGTAQYGLTEDVRALYSESEAHVRLHREAEQYNAMLRQVPSCWVAPAMGFRPWRMRAQLRR
jgi:hypothetical protein